MRAKKDCVCGDAESFAKLAPDCEKCRPRPKKKPVHLSPYNSYVMTYNRINNLSGWVVFAVALVVYLLTMAPTASFWDCGEFISCANELEVPHPPGAPFFILIGRIFAMFAGGDVTKVALSLNIMSALFSAFTVLFTFWITSALARKLVVKGDEAPGFTQTLVIIAAGAVAGLANAFADSFWFNAVEAEVYALSSFFTAVVVWLMLKWEARADEPGNERWLILIAYLMGLSIGVHLLNLLTVPALAFIFYFRKYSFSWQGFWITSLISVAILGIIQTGIILYTFDLAWAFEQALVGVVTVSGKSSGLGLPIGSGLVLFFLLLFGGMAALVVFSARKNLHALNVSALAAVVIYIGFSSYAMIPIRSGANPPIDENNPENTQTFVSYMKREQYGNRPLIYGPLYNANPVDLVETGKEYILEEGAKQYKELGNKVEYAYKDSDKKVFPRMYERSRYNAGPHAYANYVSSKGRSATDPSDDKPSGLDDLSFFFGYQVNHMYWRYFFWNFVGRESDIQDAGWESGINFSKTSRMPEWLKDAPGRNNYFAIPFLLGILGLGWQVGRRGQDAAVVGLLFFFTGLAIIIYLNQYPAQPRERDYSFAGSFQTFAIWIGLGVVALYQLLEKYLKGGAAYLAAGIGLLAPGIMLAQNWNDHSRAGNYLAPDSAYNLLNSLEKNAVLFTNGDNDTFPLWYIQEVEGVRTDVRVLCLSYVNTDWYIDQMKRQVNESPALPLTLERDKYVGQKNQSRNQGTRDSLTVSLPSNTRSLIEKGIISEEDSAFVQTPMKWTFATRGSGQGHYLELKDVLILNLLENVAKGQWERPVYFANTVSPESWLDLNPYFRQEGLAYRILPVRKAEQPDPYDQSFGYFDLERMRKHMTEDFQYRNLADASIYYDENAVRMLSNYHQTFYRLVHGYLSRAEDLERRNAMMQAQTLSEVTSSMVDANNKQIADYKAKALAALQFAEEKFPVKVALPEPFLVLRYGILYDGLGNAEKADEYFSLTQNHIVETLRYYNSTGDYFPRLREYFAALQFMQQYYTQEGRTEKAQELGTLLPELQPKGARAR
ncbi:MAG: DUF2723 domain-containing protein [Bacteroidetes bacterium]|nr:MAG: DUF2723 domain-containing protein [Bacteroidota bacterium]